MQATEACTIHKLEVTGDTLTGRGGLAFFVKYVETIGIVGLLLSKFASIKKSAKGITAQNLFLQALYFRQALRRDAEIASRASIRIPIVSATCSPLSNV